MLILIHIVDVKHLLCARCCATVGDTRRTNTQTEELMAGWTSFQMQVLPIFTSVGVTGSFPHPIHTEGIVE